MAAIDMRAEAEKRSSKSQKVIYFCIIYGTMYSNISYVRVDNMPDGLIVGLVILGIAVIIFILCIVSLVKSHKYRVIRKKEQKEAKQKRKDLKDTMNLTQLVTLRHMAGLPISEGAECDVGMNAEFIVFGRNGDTFKLPLSKVSDMCIKTETDIRNAYVSSVGSAVAGGVIFGPLGAMVGGRTKKITDTIAHNFFIIAYEKDGKTEYISFDCSGVPAVYSYITAFQNCPKENKTVTL